METPEEIDREIQALHTIVAQKRQSINSPEAKEELMQTEKDVRVLEESWNYAKEEQQHLFEETRKKYESDIYDIVSRIKTIERNV